MLLLRVTSYACISLFPFPTQINFLFGFRQGGGAWQALFVACPKKRFSIQVPTHGEYSGSGFGQDRYTKIGRA